MGLAWGVGYFLSLNLFEKYNLDLNSLKQLALGVFITSWIGAKVFFLWFSSGPKLYQYIYANYFWLGGGFVFYGGLVFGLLFFILWSLVLKKFDHKNAALLLPGVCFGHAIGRIGCFLAGCCYGNKSNSFFTVMIQNENRIPVQLYEAIGLFFIGSFLLKNLKKFSNSNLISIYFISYSILRFILEYYRGDEIRGIYEFGLSSSQIVSLILIACFIPIILKPILNRDN